MLLRVTGVVYAQDDEAAIARANAAALGRVEPDGLNHATPEVKVPSQTSLARPEVRISPAPAGSPTLKRFSIQAGEIPASAASIA
jgi:hypothetical protein